MGRREHAWSLRCVFKFSPAAAELKGRPHTVPAALKLHRTWHVRGCPCLLCRAFLLTGFVQVAHLLHEGGDKAVQASQRQDGPQVGGVDDEGVARHAKHLWHTGWVNAAALSPRNVWQAQHCSLQLLSLP